MASQVALVVKNPPVNAGGLGWEDPLEKKMATCSSILAWRIPWTEDPGRLQSIGSQRVEHHWSDLAHSTHTSRGEWWPNERVTYISSLYISVCIQGIQWIQCIQCMEDKTNICFTRPGGLESIHCLSDGWLRSVPMNKLPHSNYRKTLEMLLTLSQSSPLEALITIFTKSSAESFHLCVTNVKFMEKSWGKKGRGSGEFLVYFTPNPWRLRW